MTPTTLLDRPPELGWQHHTADATFHKTLTPERARAEVTGWHSLDGSLPVPRLLDRRPDIDRVTLIYEDVFARGRCDRLLADEITLADADPSRVGQVTALVEAVCDNWRHALEPAPASLQACVAALFADRLRPGSRLDHWYSSTTPTTIICDTGIYHLHLPLLLDRIRTVLPPDSRWPTAITQGDPTEPNIAAPLCWLDLEHAGRNTLIGEAANLLWYLLAMGGWLVPTYQPTTHAATLRHPGTAAHQPQVPHLSHHSDRVELDFRMQAGPGRRAALDTLLSRLQGDLAAHLAPQDATPGPRSGRGLPCASSVSSPCTP